MRFVATSIVIGAFFTPAFADLPLLWRVQLQARSTNTSGIATFNLPPGSLMTNRTAAIADDGRAAVHFTLPAGSGIDGFFVGSDGSGSTPIVTLAGTGFSGSDLDFNANLLTCISQMNPSSVSLRSATTGAQSDLFNTPNLQLVTTFARPRIVNGGSGIGYRGSTAGGVRKWIVDSFTGPVRNQTLYLADGPLTNYSFLYPPTTNASLHMGGKVDDFNGTGSIVRADSPVSVVTVFNGASPNVDFVAGGTDMNDNDQIAFFVRYNIGPTTRFSLLRSDGVTTDVLANGGDAGIQTATMANFSPAINNRGFVAFRARDGAGDALFVADGVRIVRVTGHGDSVSTDLGSMMLGLSTNALSGAIDINSKGQVAFSGILSNGCIGLFIATPCFADFNGDMVVDFFDYLDFVDVFAAGSLDADFNNDGVIDFFDYLDFVDAFAAGC